MSTTSLLRQSLMAKEKKEKQDSTTSMLRRSLEVNAGVAPGTFSPTNTADPTTPQRVYKPGAKAYAPINLRSLAESTVAPADSQEQTAPKYVSPFAKNEDYAELSRYKSTKNAEDIDNRNFIDKAIDWIIGAKDNEESKKYNSVTGYTTKDYDDELYEYINRNPDVVSRVNTNEATSGQYFSGVDQSFLQEMEDAEIADYNYLYATQGKDKANEFLQNLKKDLTKRQMEKYVAENQQYARENPVAASAWSVLAKPLEGVSLAGQLMDYKLDRDVDPNAGYNRFVKQNQTIRQTVPENWSKAGQFLYGTGMSILDNVYNMALVGAFGDIGGLGSVAEQVTLGLMSSSAASESVLESLEDGYSADRAIIQGALAGAIEYLTEKISWGALMEPNAWKDGTIKYILKNVRQEGLEEGISTVANWGVDLIGDIVTDENRSDLREVFTDYKDGNYKAMWGKLRDMGIDLALDVAGGALSGGVLAGGGSLVNLAANTIVGNNANADYSQSQIGNYVQESFNDTVGNNDASDYQQSLAKKAMNQFDQNGKVSNRTLGELMKSNAYMESERAASNNLLGEAMEQINSGKTVSDSTVKEILDNKRAVDFLSRNSGLQLQDNMTRPERFQAVRNSLNQMIQQIDEVQAPARKVVSEIRQQNEAYQQKTDMVSQFAKTLGEQGGRTLMHMAANEDLPNITSLAGAYTKVYNEVKANPEVNLNEVSDEIDNRFTPSQLYSVYQAAVSDREADFKENGVPYEGETTNGRSEDNGGNGVGQTDVDSGVGVESLSRWTAEAEKGNPASERARIIAKNQAAVSGQPKVTAKEAGFANGSNREEHRTTQVVPEDNWASLDEDTYSFFKELKSQGYNVIGYVGDTFFEDPLSTNDRGEHPIVTMRGFIRGKTIGVRVDAELSSRQIIMHELFHDMVASDSELQSRMLDKLNDKYKGRMDRVFQDYVSHYEWMLPEDATPEQIEEWTNRVYNEILADAYAGIEPLRYTMNYRTASQFTEDVREMVSGNGLGSDANGTRAGPAFSREESNGNDRTADSDTQYSIDSFINAAGLNATLEGGRVVVYDDFGNRVSKVTTAMMEKSGIGALINFAASDNALRKATISKADAAKQIQGATDLLNLMINAQDGELVWRFAGSAAFSAVKSNADGQYGTTIDFTTVCRKTQEMMTALSNAMIENGRGLTKEEVIELQKDILEEGGTVPCPVCYVFSRWAGIGGILDNMNKWQNKYGHEYDDPEVLRARMEELQRATKTKKDLRAFLKEHDSEYNSMAGEKEYLQTERRKLKGRLRRKGLTAAEIKELNERVNVIDVRLEELKKGIEDIEKSGAPELAWLTRVRSQAGYWKNGFVPKETLFNLDDAATFAEQYTLAWKYRTSRGPSAGKAILPYSDMRLGAMILGPGRNPAQNDLFKKVGAEFNKAQTAEINKAIKRVLAQNLIGGQRFQSTSDFRYDYALDYLMAFWECQALGSKMQTYTKIVEFAELAATVGGDVNLSVMPLEKGYKDGKLVFSSVTGMDIEAASKANAMFDNVQLILVGINDEHIRLALRDDQETGGNLIGFVIPYHASGASINQFIRGLVENLGESFNEDYYKDYSPLQNDVVIDGSKTAEHLREIRRMILRNEQTDAAKKLDDDNVGILTPEELDLIRGTSVDISDRSFAELRDIERRALRGDKKALAEYRSWSAGILWDVYNKMRVDKTATETYGVELNSEQSKNIMPHEYWNKTVDRDHAYVNGFIFRSYCNSLGLAPRFTGINNNGKRIDYGDFSDEAGYWKTLIDRPMYKNDGTYRDQQALNVTNVTNEMLTPEYGEEQWGAWKVAEPSEERAKRAAQRFTDRHSHFSRDTDYMEAVNSGDMDTAQRMVDEAAKDAGYVLSVYHGTGEYFNTFMRGDEGIHLGNEEQAKQVAKLRYEHRSQTTMYHLRDVWENISSMDTDARWDLVTKAWTWQDYYQTGESIPPFDGDINNDKEVLDYVNRIAEEYNEGNDREVGDVPFSMRTFDRKTGENIMHLYAKISNPFVINGDIAEWFPSEIASVLLDRSNGIETRKRWDDREYSIGGSPFTLNDSQTERLKALTTYKVKGDDAWDSLAGIFSELGFDGIQYLNQYEGDKNSDSFIALHPSDVKSADPVTYDDQGNIIPLSQRFNKQNDDIRYSRDSEQDNRVKANFGTMFSGTGTVDFALRNVINHSFAVEYDNNISAVYRMNNGDEIYEGDVRDAVKQGYIDDKEVDFLHASPVCKDYSAQKQDATETPLDISTAKAVADVIDSKKPKLVTIENVRGYKNSRAVKLIQDALDRNGYVWDEDTYKASDFGGATIRERYFIRAARDVSELPAIPEKKQAKSWYEATKDLIPDLREMPLKKGGYMESRWNEIKDSIDRTHPVLLLRGTKGGNLVYAEYDKPSPTIIASETEARIVMPDGRFLEASPRVLARIQGLPDEFKLPKQKTLANKVVGNGVPVELTQAVLGSLLPVISGEDYSDIRFSRDTAPEFYSKLEREIEGYKGEKLGAASVTSYLKGKGVKDEEIKWTGIVTFLEGKKSVSKAELLQYVRDNQIQVLDNTYNGPKDLVYKLADKLSEHGLNIEDYFSVIDDSFQADFLKDDLDTLLEAKSLDDETYKDLSELWQQISENETRWDSFTLPGGSDYREILYKIPGSNYTNLAMGRHWGSNGKGVLAHARVQDFDTGDGKILFVEEIQSDWHNAGQSGTYRDDSTKELADKLLVYDVENRFFHDEEAKSFVDRINSSRGRSIYSQYNALYQQASLYRDAVINNTEDGFEDFYKGLYNYELTNDDKAFINKYIDLFKEANENESLQKEILKARNATPDAPFRNGTYIQYVLKDLLRKAAEGGYDYLAWTTGKMQEDRWSSEYAEGYRIEYDQDIPKFLSKYGKQWGAKLTEIPLSPFGNTANEEDSAVIAEYAQDVDTLDQFWHDFAPSDFERSMLFDRLGSLTGNIDYAADDLLDSGFTQEEIDRAREISETLDEAYNDGTITGEMFAERDEDSDEFYTGTVPAIPITDAMKESVLYEGQPRFSRDTTGMESELQKQNRELNKELKEVTERYHYFKDQLVLTKVRQATEKSANRVAKQLVKDYSSNVSADEIAKALREASKLVLNVKDDTDIGELQTQLKDALRPYAMQMVTNASELINAEDVETQKSIRNDLRNGTGIIVTEQMKKDVPDWASFRKAQFGNMKLVSGPKTNIHDVYLELSQKYGEGYFPADVANESDMLQVIADVMADLSAIYDNPYTYGGANIAEAIESCTNDMMMSVVGSLEAEQPTFADKEKAKRDALRKQAIEAKNAALQRVREQRDKTLAKQSARYKDRIDSIYRKRKQYEYRGKIRKKSKDLSTLLLRPTDKRHIPYELQGVVLEVLKRIDTGSSFDFDLNNGTAHVPRGTGMETGKTNAFLNLKKQLSELKNHLVLDPSLFDSEDGGTMGMLSTLSGLESRSIDDMTLEQLDAVYTVLRNVENLVQKYNKALKLERFETISEAATAIFDENGNKTSRDEYVKGIEDTINLLAVDSLTPQAFFHRLGKSGDALFKMLRAAQDDNIRILREAQKFSEEHGLYKLKLKNYERELVTVRFGNRDVEMSKAQLMELYVLNKRDASRMHLEVGGILPEPVQRKRSIKKVTYSEAIHNITQEDIAKAMTQLSAEDIALADAMQEFLSKTISKHGNDASMRVYGYKKFGEENYWPIRVNDQELKTELGKSVKQRRRSVSQMGFTIAIKPNAKQSVFIGSIFDTFSEHVAEMATYSSYLDVMEDLNRIYNFNEKDESGAIDMSTKLVLRKVLGPKGEAYFTKLAEDIANPVPATPTFFSGLIGKFKAAAVGSNLRVIIQQPTAIFRAMSMIDPKYLAIGIAKFRKGASKAVEKAPIAQWKEWGYFDISTGRSVKNILFENSSTLDRAQNLLMAGAGKADSVAWGALYSAVEAETKDLRPDLDPRSKEFDDVVVARFSDIIDQTQVVDGVLQRSHLMRSENWLDKTATSFMAEPTKQLNMMMTAVYDLVHGENKGEATRTLARTTGALLFAGVLNAAVQSIVDAIRNDDPEKDYWEKFLAKFTGDEATFAGFLDSNLGDFLNPMQYVTYAKDIYSLFQGFEVERMDTSLLKSAINDGKSLVNAFNGKGKYSLTNNLINFMNTMSKFLGLSVSNVKRDAAGIANTIAQETGSYVFEYRMAKFTYNLNQATNKGRFVQILAKAYEAGDTEAFNIIMNDLIKEDKFATTTMTTEEWIKKRLKDKHQIVIK